MGKRSLFSQFVVEPLAARNMLAERIVGEEDLVLGKVGEHGVGPVEHRCFDKDERLSAEFDLVEAFEPA